MRRRKKSAQSPTMLRRPSLQFGIELTLEETPRKDQDLPAKDGGQQPAEHGKTPLNQLPDPCALRLY